MVTDWLLVTFKLSEAVRVMTCFPGSRVFTGTEGPVPKPPWMSSLQTRELIRQGAILEVICAALQDNQRAGLDDLRTQRVKNQYGRGMVRDRDRLSCLIQTGVDPIAGFHSETHVTAAFHCIGLDVIFRGADPILDELPGAPAIVAVEKRVDQRVTICVKPIPLLMYVGCRLPSFL